MLENSARVGGRVCPWVSNLRLASAALYFNDTDISLPINVIKRVKNETIQKMLTVTIKDFQGGSQEVVNDNERAARVARSLGVIGWEFDSNQFLESFQPDEVLFPQNSPLIGVLPCEISSFSSTTNSAVNVNGLNGVLLSGLAFFHIARHISVVAPVIRNVSKDVKSVAEKFSQVFFSKKAVDYLEQNEETSLALPVAKL